MNPTEIEARIEALVTGIYAHLVDLGAASPEPDPQPAAASFFTRPEAGRMDATVLEALGIGGREDVLRAAAALWRSRGEDGLAALAPQLTELAALLAQMPRDAGDGKLRDDLYVMF